MNRIIYILCLILFACATPVVAQSYTIESVPNIHLQDGRQYVSNPDRILSPRDVATLNQLLGQLEETNSTEFHIVALNSIGEADGRTFANELFEQWGIGKADKDNGLLLLFIKDQRKALTEVGYGLEGLLPDGVLSSIMRKQMVPDLKQGEYGAGLIKGTQAIIQIITTPEANAELRSTQPAPTKDGIGLYEIFLYYIVGSFLVFLLHFFSFWSDYRKVYQASDFSRYRILSTQKQAVGGLQYWFPLFLIPFLMWCKNQMKALRNHPQLCDSCGRAMRKLSEEEEDDYLSKSEQEEELIRSIDYDVWLCDHDHRTKIFAYEEQYTKYTRCPHCHAKTYSLEKDRILIRPTSFAAGVGEKSYFCQNCHHRDYQEYQVTQSINPAAAAIGTSILMGGRGHRFGGNFGDDISGGDFGGGESGGGGAEIDW